MKIQSKSLDKIRKQAGALYTKLMRSSAFRQTEKSIGQLEDIGKQMKSLDPRLIYDRETKQAFGDNFSLGTQRESDLQDLLTKWQNISPDSFPKQLLETPDEVEKDISNGTIEDVPYDEWYDESDFGADRCVDITRDALDYGYPYYTVQSLNDDLIDPVATAVAPRSVYKALIKGINYLKAYGASSKGVTSNYGLIKKDMQLITHGGAFQEANLKDLKTIQKALFNSKKLSNSSSAVQNACMHLDRFLNRHHQKISDYPLGKNAYIIKNRYAFDKVVKLARIHFLRGDDIAPNLAELLEEISERSKSKYIILRVKKYDTKTPIARQIVRILFHALGI